MTTWLSLAVFWALLGFTASDQLRRKQLFARNLRDWVLDISGLVLQGILIPLVLTLPLIGLYQVVFPNLASTVHLPAAGSFLIAFVAVDYFYYWNHRLLHTLTLWPLHAVHHSAAEMDVLVTSRNTLWTSLLFVHLWATSIAMYLLSDSTPYLIGASLTAMLDLARHSPIDLSRFPWLERRLGSVFVLPRDHALHHADLPDHGNYGANLIWWDKLHGSFLGARRLPAKLGVENSLGIARSLLWPFESK